MGSLGTYRNQTIAGPLREETDCEDDEESEHVATGLEESLVGSAAGRLVFDAKSFLDLFQFYQDDRVVGVAVRVVL